jgi:hypothetical protein
MARRRIDPVQPRQISTNPLCPHRSACLARAIDLDPPALNCSTCPHRYDADPIEVIFKDHEGALELLWALFEDGKAFDRIEAERLLFGRPDWKALPGMPDL